MIVYKVNKPKKDSIERPGKLYGKNYYFTELFK